MNPRPAQDERGRFTSEAKPITLPERFMKYVMLSETGCWNWCGCRRSDGYGSIMVDGKTELAHRVSYRLLSGDIPEGTVIHHRCFNRRCVNPEHLEPTSRRDNTLNGTSPSALAARKTHCPQGHPYSGNNLLFTTKGGRLCRICRDISNGRRPAAKAKGEAA